MKCPIHHIKLSPSTKFIIPDGFDPKMIRGACNKCNAYWYKSPKWSKVKTKEEIKIEFGMEI